MKIKKLVTHLAIACTAIGVAACNGGSSSGGSNGGGQNNTTAPEIMGYYTNWSTYGANYQPSNIPGQINAVLYAFAQVGDCAAGSDATMTNTSACTANTTFTGNQDWKLHSSDPYSDFYSYKDASGATQTGLGNIAKTLATGKKVRLSVGGWSLSAAIDTAITSDHRQAFAQSIIDFMHQAEADAATKGTTKKFDGIDIDWEPNGNLWTLPPTDSSNVALTKADLENYYQFLSVLKTLLTNNGYPTLTIAMTANPKAIANVDQVYGDKYWKKIADLGIKLDLMTYDYNAQGWDSSCAYTEFNSPLKNDPANPCSSAADFTIDASYNALSVAGVSNDHIGIGVPVYGHAYALNSVSDVTASNPYALYNANGLNNVTNYAIPSFGQTWTNRNILTGRAYGGTSASENTTWTTVTDYSPAAQTVATAWVNYTYPAFITYTSFNDAKNVMTYAMNKGLSGVMVWELDQDVQPGDTSASGSALDWASTSVVAGLIAGTGVTPSPTPAPSPTPSTPYFILQVTNTAPDQANPNAYASATLVVNGGYYIFGTSWGSPIVPGNGNQQWGTTPSANNPATPGVADSSNLDGFFANGATSFTTSQILINGYPSQTNLNSPANQYNCSLGTNYTFQAGHSYNLMVNAVYQSCAISQIN